MSSSLSLGSYQTESKCNESRCKVHNNGSACGATACRSRVVLHNGVGPRCAEDADVIYFEVGSVIICAVPENVVRVADAVACLGEDIVGTSKVCKSTKYFVSLLSSKKG